MAERIPDRPVRETPGLVCEGCGRPAEVSAWMGSSSFESQVCRTAGCDWEGRDVRIRPMVLDEAGALVVRGRRCSASGPYRRLSR